MVGWLAVPANDRCHYGDLPLVAFSAALTVVAPRDPGPPMIDCGLQMVPFPPPVRLWTAGSKLLRCTCWCCPPMVGNVALTPSPPYLQSDNAPAPLVRVVCHPVDSVVDGVGRISHPLLGPREVFRAGPASRFPRRPTWVSSAVLDPRPSRSEPTQPHLTPIVPPPLNGPWSQSKGPTHGICLACSLSLLLGRHKGPKLTLMDGGLVWISGSWSGRWSRRP